MSTRITATAAAKGFSDLLNRIKYRGERFEITRGGVVVALVGPPARQFNVRDMVALLEDIDATELGMADDLEAIQSEQPTLEESSWDS